MPQAPPAVAGADSDRRVISQNEVMGAGASTAAGLENPFPIEPAMEKDLIRLSFVVTRLLNSPDIYDLNNLARPGSCGDYAVFLKDKLEKRLLPFIADISDEKIAVVYQNPLKAFTSTELRKQVCQNLTDTMLRLVSIVVACLASLQFESPRARSTSSLQQRGGANEGLEIIRWFQQNGYVSASSIPSSSSTSGYFTVDLQNPAIEDGPAAAVGQPRYSLQLRKDANPEDGSLVGYLTVTGEGYPKGYLKINILRPLPILTGSPTATSVLPLQVVDNTGLSWMCGVLYQYTFISLTPAKKVGYPFDIFSAIFRKSLQDAPITESLIESRTALQAADTVFTAGRRNPQQLLEALGYRTQGAGVAPFGYPGPVGGFPGGYPGATAPAGGLGPLNAPLLPRRPAPSLAALAAASGPARSGDLLAGEYAIPPPAAKAVLTTFRRHAGEIGAANNPAQIRATLLAGQVLRDRTIQTRICQDPYWTAANLATVYPWAALQFLCVKNLRTLGTTAAPLESLRPVVPTPVIEGGAATPVQPPPSTTTAPRIDFSAEWKKFVEDLHTVYDAKEGLPKLSAKEGSLESLRFLDVAKTRGCATPGRSPRARFQEIQNGVLRLQGLYEEHAKAVWKLLNSLIFILEDPDKKSEIIRLNPQIFSSGMSTSAFIEEKAVEARNLLKEFYLTVEKTYTETILRMRVLE